MHSRAWPNRFDDLPWAEIATRFHGLTSDHAEFRCLADIVDSVLACGADRRLAGLLSMHDLVVTPRPVPAGPIEVVVVRSTSSGLVGAGGVLIEHRSTTGHDDRIARPGTEAVPLFWRFMAEKFAVQVS